MIRGITLATLVLCSLGTVRPGWSQGAEDLSWVTPGEGRVLQHRIVVPASRAEVWDAFTTSEGVRSWAVPVASVDFRIGGIWESSYRIDAEIGDPENIQNRFVSYLPMRMLSIQAVQAPSDFPNRESLADLVTVIELDEVSARETRVTISMVGFGEDAAYDAVYDLFAAGNPWSLEQLRRRFGEGPIEWERSVPPGSTP